MRIILFFYIIISGAVAGAQPLSDAALKRIDFEQKPGAAITLDLPFRDESGRTVHLGDYFHGKPVILVLGYYGCPMLCTLVLNGMVSTLQDISWQMGRDYEVVNVSIDPHESVQLAASKKQSYAQRFGQAGAAAGWHFLTGDEPAIRKLASQVGFNYAYDPTIRQYAHPSGLVILTPKGHISHYLFGVVFSGADMTKALADAASAKTGSPIEQLFLLCFHYSPITGRYSGLVLGVVRVLAVTLVVGLGGLIAMNWRGSANSEKQGKG
jgi:protein SCO1/2